MIAFTMSHEYLPRDFMSRPLKQMWEHCNRCGYAFKKKDSGEVDGKDVVEHKRGCGKAPQVGICS